MSDDVALHYGRDGLSRVIAEGLRKSGKDLGKLETLDLAAVDEFHFRGRGATLELVAQMKLSESSKALDIGSGLGGAARALAEVVGCKVTGIDLTQEFCDAARVMSDWVKLGELTEFQQGDATNLNFSDSQFNAAMTIHVAMNIPAKDKMYKEARRVLKPGGIFAVYDILQGEGGEALLPAPWAQDPSLSHLATTEEMTALLSDAGFNILDVQDSTEESLNWLEERASSAPQSGSSPVTIQVIFGEDFPEMINNQLKGLRDRRIRTVSFICDA
jgi:ubiquinone/menaquinone biosynthesis C-methylase UbiE